MKASLVTLEEVDNNAYRDAIYLNSKKTFNHKAGTLHPPCEVILRYVLPAYRALVVKALIEKHGFSQVAAAKSLGTTQAAISYYLHSKRGNKFVRELEEVPGIRSSVDKIVEDMKEKKVSPSDAMAYFCELCAILKDSEFLKTLSKKGLVRRMKMPPKP